MRHAKVTTNSKAQADKLLQQDTNRKIIYSASMEVQVKKLENQVAETMKIAESFEGYIVHAHNENITIRVKVQHFDTAMTVLSQLGEIKDKTITGKDVTDSYFDITTRLENAEKTRNRYLELLNKAEKVSDIIMIEKELERLNREIEGFKGRLEQYDELVEYATISIRFKEKTKLGPLGYVAVGLYKAVKFLFVWN